MSKMKDDIKHVKEACDDAECVADEEGKWYVREAAEQHEMSEHFDTKEEAWADARQFCIEYLGGS